MVQDGRVPLPRLAEQITHCKKMILSQKVFSKKFFYLAVHGAHPRDGPVGVVSLFPGFPNMGSDCCCAFVAHDAVFFLKGICEAQGVPDSVILVGMQSCQRATG